MDDRVTELKRAGFTVSYAWREDATRFGYLSSSAIRGEYGMFGRSLTVTGEASEHYGEPYVSFDGVATGDDSYGQSDSVKRSNYRSLRRDFPTFPWVDTSFMNVNVLGCFVSDLDDDMTGIMIGLVEQYPAYDDGDVSDLESDEIGESWAEYMRGEIWSELPEVTRTTIWDYLSEDTVTDLWWTCVSADVFGNYPEHRGVEVVWGDRAERARDFRPYLCAAYWAKRTGRDTEADAPMWVWVGRLADRLRDRAEIERLYRAWMADETVMHHDGAWRDYLGARGWVLTATGARRKGTEEA
jgi:hypothetical protein